MKPTGFEARHPSVRANLCSLPAMAWAKSPPGNPRQPVPEGYGAPFYSSVTQTMKPDTAIQYSHDLNHYFAAIMETSSKPPLGIPAWTVARAGGGSSLLPQFLLQ